MTLGSILDAVRRRWLLLVVGGLVGLVAAAAVSLATPHRYASSTSVYVAGIDGTGSGADAYADSLLVSQRIASYTDLLVSARVLEPAGQQVGQALSPGDVAAVTQANSAVVGITVTGNDPGRAAAASNAVAARFVEVVTEVERPRGPAAPAAVNPVILDRAAPTATPISPHTGTNVLLGLVAGLVVGAAAAVLLGALDTRVRSITTLATATGTAVLGTLPPARPSGPAGDAAADPRFVESIRRLRAHLATGDTAPGVVVITAAMSGAGTTTVVRALAAALASSRRVLVVDANLRRPAIAERAGLPDGPGLTEVLAGEIAPEEAVRTAGGPGGPDVLPAGRRSGDPGETLASPRTATVLEHLRSHYDVVLVDTPPLVPVVDAATVARHGDGAVLLARQGVTTTAELRAATATLSRFGAGLLGTVLTFGRVDTPTYEPGPPPRAAAVTAPPPDARPSGPGQTPDPVGARGGGEIGDPS